jgi:hypothetical protein
MLLQRQSGFLQVESTINKFCGQLIWDSKKNWYSVCYYRHFLFKLVTLNRILNRITEVTSGCWWLVVVNAIPISDICQINQQNISSYSVINKNFLNCIANLNSP